MSAQSTHLQKLADRLPESPGVYLMKDARGKLLYVGKAINVRNRVRSYFPDTHDDRPHIRFMLSKLHAIDWIATNTETEALLLEANLIRLHKPRYNVDLKDDKHYPYLKLTPAEHYPRLLVTRRIENDGAKYFGPYTDAHALKRIQNHAKRIFKIRDCKKNLPLNHAVRPCLNYSIGRCYGACAGLIDAKEYDNNVEQLIQFLKGRRTDLCTALRHRMQEASDNLDFEGAALLRDQIALVEVASNAQRVDLADPDTDCDVFGFSPGEHHYCLTVLHFREGLLLAKRHFLIERNRWEHSPGDRDQIVLQFYLDPVQECPREIFLSSNAGFSSHILQELLSSQARRRITVITPCKGTKLRLVEMADKNARLCIMQRTRKTPDDALLRLQEVLSLPRVPQTIEAFDISNLGEAFAVAAMACFINGKPKKSGNRRYRIRTVRGQNDFAMLMEAVTRRLTRCINENIAFPDLLLIDGGRGQLTAAMNALQPFEKAPMVIALAKKEELLFSPFRRDPIRLPSTHPARKLVERIRNEVHRQAISYHRLLRGKQFKRSELEKIPGIGPEKARTLLRTFGSVKRLKEARVEQIAAVSGFSLQSAQSLIHALQEQ